MKRLDKFFSPILLALVLALTAGCGHNLPGDLREQAFSLEKAFETAKTHITDQQKRYEKVKSSSNFSDMAATAKKEGWERSFDQAREELARAKDLYRGNVAPLVKADDPATAGRLKTEITRVKGIIQTAGAAARAPFDRMDRIRTAMTDTRALYTRGMADGSKITETVKRLKKGPVAKAFEKFPDAAALIRKRVAPMERMAGEAQTRMDILKKEYQAHDSGKKADYAAFVTAADQLAADAKEIDTAGPKLSEDIRQLYKSYTKVLQDMKVDTYLTINRESWDENSDYYNPVIASFTRKVSPQVFEALADIPDDIAVIVPSFFGKPSFKNKVGSAWDALKINPGENWPDRRHNAASFWVEETREDYFHKYLVETDGKTEETGWVKVNPSFFEQHEENLGMAILSKPYGEFEPDSTAAPPGMAYVGNPEYGEWKKDENGDSFWAWYGRYALFSHLFFFPPSYYYYGSWNRWRNDYRHKKPYYGRTSSGQYTYGTRGTKIKGSPRYQNTTFAKTGGFKSRPASVRGAGASVRGGGPGGKGK